MTKNSKDQEYDPEKNKEIKKGPLKPDHKNQFGDTAEDENREHPKRAVKHKDEENKK